MDKGHRFGHICILNASRALLFYAIHMHPRIYVHTDFLEEQCIRRLGDTFSTTKASPMPNQ